MTNAELIDKIKVEIERLKTSYGELHTDFLCESLLSFLDTLESEKPINPDELKKEIEKTWLEYECYNEDYDKVAEMRWNEFEQVVRHFTQWGAEWQAKQDQETIELAEDHAYLAGAVNEREKILSEAVEGEITKDNRGNNAVRAGVFNKDFEYGDKVRVIILPKEESK